MTTIKEYLRDNINASYILDLRNNETICSLSGWLENVGVASMTDVTMQTIVDAKDIKGWCLDFIDVYESVLNRRLKPTEIHDVVEIYFWHKSAA